MMNEIYSNNLNALKRRAPEFYDKFLQCLELEEKENILVSAETANNGSKIIAIEKDGYFTCMNSTYNPEVEAYKYALQYENLQDTTVYLILGFGNGMAAKEIMCHATDNLLIMFYEPSITIFRTVLEHFDIVKLIEDERIAIFVKGINEYRIALYLNANVQRDNFEMVHLDFLPRYRKLYRDELEWCRNLIIERKKMVKLEINTVRAGRRHFLENAIYNLEYIMDARAGDDFVEAFPKDLPAILVAAGPSLSKNIDVLKCAKGKSFIVAVDRVASYMIEHGVEPDLIVTVDFHKELKLFDDDRLRKIPYAIITDVNYRVLHKLDGAPLIYCASDTKLYAEVFEKYNHTIQNLSAGGSVATFAFGLLNYWGFQTMIFVGQDLAWNDTQCHVGEAPRASAYGKLIEVEGNIEKTVYTTEDFYSYIQYFDLYIEHECIGKEIINATEGGARIKGTQIMPLSQVIEKYCKVSFSFRELFNQIPTIVPSQKSQEVYELLETKGKSLRTLGKLIKEGGLATSRLLTLVERKDFGKEFKTLNQKLSSISTKFDENSMSEFYNKSIADDEIDVMMDLYAVENDVNDESIRLYKKLETAYKAMQSREQEIEEIYDDMLMRLRKRINEN